MAASALAPMAASAVGNSARDGCGVLATAAIAPMAAFAVGSSVRDGCGVQALAGTRLAGTRHCSATLIGATAGVLTAGVLDPLGALAGCTSQGMTLALRCAREAFMREERLPLSSEHCALTSSEGCSLSGSCLSGSCLSGSCAAKCCLASNPALRDGATAWRSTALAAPALLCMERGAAGRCAASDDSTAFC